MVREHTPGVTVYHTNRNPPRMVYGTALMRKIARRSRIELTSTEDGATLLKDLIYRCHQSDDAYLDVLDAILGCHTANHAGLREVLDEGGSVWTVAAHGKGLELKVDSVATEAFEQAAAPGDIASNELRQAWARAYGRDTDPSDAWDHAIKAVEAILAPIVIPAQDKPQIGHVLGQLRSQGSRWRLALPGPAQDNAIDPLVTMLGTIWPNPDRHSAGNPRTPSADEARCVLHLAVTIVQWSRSGAIRKAT